MDGRAQLRLTHEIRGSSLIALFSPLLARIAREANLDGSLDDVFRDGSRKMVLTVETDPATLRPRHTRFEMTLELQLLNGERHEQREVRDVTWDWKAAERSISTTVR